MTDNQHPDILDIIQFFRSAADEKAPRTAAAYHQAISLFHHAGASVSDFLILLATEKYSYKTSLHYAEIISSLIKRLIGNNPAFNFQFSISHFKSLPPSLWDNAFDDADFSRLLNTLKNASSQTGETAVATDILLLSLLNGAMPLEEIAALKIDDTDSLTPESEEIVTRQTDPRRRYIFPLNQSRLTPRQLSDHVESLLLRLFRLRSLPTFGTVNQTIRTYWAYTALRAGVTPAKIIRTVGTPAGIPVLSLLNYDSVESSDSTRETAFPEISDLILLNPRRWYAMRLRPHVTFANLTERFADLKTETGMASPTLFYPCEEITKKIGKRKIFVERPVIRDIVFFNTRATDILPMFAKIGDLAWCYKTDGAHGATYAPIPRRSFERFQQAIGHFTPDYDIAPLGELELLPGEKLNIIGGLFTGIDADFTEETNTLYRFHLIGDNGFDWRFGVDKRQARKP